MSSAVKSFRVVVLCLLALSSVAHASELKKPVHNSSAVDSSTLNANRIWAFLNNRGSLVYKDGRGGCFWMLDPRGMIYSDVILFDAGLGLIGKVGGTLRMSLTQWGSSYAPGPVINGKPALSVRPQDSARYRPYKISQGDTPSSNPDYAEWPTDLGAPVDAQGKPKLFGEQTIWMVYNNADSGARPLDWPILAPLPRATLEIQQLAYARRSTACDSVDLLANTVFFEWTVINKGLAAIDSAYAVLWTDLDFDNDVNPPGVDTLRQLPFCWTMSGRYGQAGRKAVGYIPLCGPIVSSLLDTAVFRGHSKPGYRNLPMSSFRPIWDDSGRDSANSFFPASSVDHLWNIARGLDYDARHLIDPTNGQTTNFPYSGDPVSGTGWYKQTPNGLGGGAGFYVFFGPFTLAQGDTQWLQAALVPALGTDNLDAIRVLRRQVEWLRSTPYDSLLSLAMSQIDCAKPTLPSTTQLYQNYPNPFNPATVIKYAIGGTRGQGLGTSEVKLVVYDLLGREVVTLVDEKKEPGSYDVTFDGTGLASGVYLYRLFTGTYVETRKLILLR
jgi:hypothetical protein